MISDKLDDLRDYPFWRMNALVADIPPPGDPADVIPMWIGEPRHGPPEIARAPLADPSRATASIRPSRGRPPCAGPWRAGSPAAFACPPA